MLSQNQSDGHLHPVAYTSYALSPAKKNYCVTDLETLAVVWAVQHFHTYLYGYSVTVTTDHSAVKSVLGSPGSNGKHARWWLKFSEVESKTSRLCIELEKKTIERILYQATLFLEKGTTTLKRRLTWLLIVQWYQVPEGNRFPLSSQYQYRDHSNLDRVQGN